MKNNLKFQAGFTLLETLITISIFAILVSLATPSFSSMVSTNSLNSSAMTLIQIIKSAQKMAHAENTYVEIVINENNILVTKQNNGRYKPTTLPRRVEAKNSVTLIFNAMGHVVTGANPNYNPTLGDTNIELEAMNGQISRTITISPSGYVSS